MATLPENAQAIVNNLMQKEKFTTKQIARFIGTSEQTVHRLRNGARPSLKTDLGLISLYLVIHPQ